MIKYMSNEINIFPHVHKHEISYLHKKKSKITILKKVRKIVTFKQSNFLRVKSFITYWTLPTVMLWLLNFDMLVTGHWTYTKLVPSITPQTLVLRAFEVVK